MLNITFGEVALNLLIGFGSNCLLFFLTLIFALPLGLAVSFGTMSRFGPVRWLFKGIIWIVRGTPLMLQIIIVFYVPGLVFHVPMQSRMLAAVIAFVINYACYFSEIYRGGIQGMAKGQYEAARVLGMTKTQTFRRIILPQVVKRIIPPMSNEIITLVKDTSLARIIAVTEIIMEAQETVRINSILWPLFFTGVFFLVFNGLLTILFHFWERKLSYYRSEGEEMKEENAPFLGVRELCKNFGKLEVVRSVSFEMAQGEVLAIIGPSGSGKSTLLRCLNFLERADRGSISLRGEYLVPCGEDGKSLYGKEEEMRKLALHFGLVFQQFNLFPHLSVLGNLTLAPMLVDHLSKQDAEALAAGLLQKVGLSDKADSYPYQLSGGQQQRVAIARALAMRPDILCFDEPTSALDPELTGEVLRVIRGLKETDSTMIVVTHEMAFARNVADKILFLDNGEAAEFGTPEEVFEHPQNERTREFINKLDEKI